MTPPVTRIASDRNTVIATALKFGVLASPFAG